MMVFYPIDPSEYYSKIDHNDIIACRLNDVAKFAHLLATNSILAKLSPVRLYHWMFMEELITPLNMVKNAELSKDFSHAVYVPPRDDIDINNPRKLHPIIFSHGLNTRVTSYSGLFRDLVSHGHIIFAPSH